MELNRAIKMTSELDFVRFQWGIILNYAKHYTTTHKL